MAQLEENNLMKHSAPKIANAFPKYEEGLTSGKDITAEAKRTVLMPTHTRFM